MVAKINIGSSLFGALSYNQTKVDQGTAKVLIDNRMMQSADGTHTIGRCMESFEPYLVANNKTEKPVLHISLNPHPDDKLTDEQFADIAKEYLEKLGYGDQPYMVYKHEDIDRHHIHIVTLRVDENGKKIDDAFQYRRSKDITRELEEKYQLRSAERQQVKDLFWMKKVDPKKGDIKKQVSNTLKTLCSTYHYQSFTEFKALLSLYNIAVEELKGEQNGKPFHGLVYSVTNDKGEKIGNPFKSSLFGKQVGATQLYNRIEQSKKLIKEKDLKSRTRTILDHAMKACKNQKDFESRLAKENIEVVFRKNDTGRIYGVTFIDHQQKTVLNGSNFGKSFSANAFEQLFNGTKDQLAPTENTHVEIPPATTSEQLLESTLNLFSLETQGEDFQENAFTNRLKRRRKKRR
ncbi:MAG: mobilization protein [Flavobacterium sp.]|nr:mobilization protein [Flavobacterium sp.]